MATLGTPKICIVENDPDIREFIHQNLQKNDYRVVTFESAYPAFEALTEIAGKSRSVIERHGLVLFALSKNFTLDAKWKRITARACAFVLQISYLPLWYAMCLSHSGPCAWSACWC